LFGLSTARSRARKYKYKGMPARVKANPADVVPGRTRSALPKIRTIAAVKVPGSSRRPGMR
jgi:hypothetical protein